MPNCQTNTDYALKDGSGNRIRDLNLSSNGQNLEINPMPFTSTECTTNINSSQYVGLVINSNNVRITGAISNLTNNASARVANHPLIIIRDIAGVLKFIGLDDLAINLQATTINVRYDSATATVYFQY